MKDNDIIKALERIAQYSGFTDDVSNTLLCTLDLINRQQAEIEKLKIDLDAMRGAANSYKMHYEKAKEELDRIEEEHKYLKKELDKHDPFYFCSIGGCEGASNTCWKDCADSMYNVTRIEAIKEFAERLKETITNEIDTYYNSNGGGYYLAEDTIEDIDNLVKEMVGEE